MVVKNALKLLVRKNDYTDFIALASPKTRYDPFHHQGLSQNAG